MNKIALGGGNNMDRCFFTCEICTRMYADLLLLRVGDRPYRRSPLEPAGRSHDSLAAFKVSYPYVNNFVTVFFLPVCLCI
jgi:hypothetical protein